MLFTICPFNCSQTVLFLIKKMSFTSCHRLFYIQTVLLFPFNILSFSLFTDCHFPLFTDGLYPCSQNVIFAIHRLLFSPVRELSFPCAQTALLPTSRLSSFMFTDCPVMTYGSQCENKCSKRCMGRLCHPDTGRCFKCNDGYSGHDCSQEEGMTSSLTTHLYSE